MLSIASVASGTPENRMGGQFSSSTQFLLAGGRSGIHPCFRSFSALLERSSDSSVTTWLFGVGEYAGKR